jgi:hypothetical protein
VCEIVEKNYEAMPANEKVLIVDTVVGGRKEAESMSSRLGLLFNIAMMVYKTGGKERTKEEFKWLFETIGFRSYKIIKFPFLHDLIVLSKS